MRSRPALEVDTNHALAPLFRSLNAFCIYLFEVAPTVFFQRTPYSRPLQIVVSSGSVPFVAIGPNNGVSIAPEVPNTE